ncbi:MAG: TRAP transporter small permease [Pseudomonadota bacterium]
MHKFIMTLSRVLALFGGLVLLALIASTTLSIIGRSLNTIGHSDYMAPISQAIAGFLQKFGPINGDYELVEAGVAIAIFSFLPWCQMTRAHATVDLFMANISRRLNAFLALIWEALLTFVTILFAWRIIIGTQEKMLYGETTFLLQMPVWQPYAVCSAIAVVAAIVGLYATWIRIQELRHGAEGISA